MRSIQITKSFYLILLTVAFALQALAQSPQMATGADKSRSLRFASRRPVEHLRLQVHDGTGALIHDSGIVAKSDLVWSLLDNNGVALKAGLYDWTLTVKEPGVSSPLVKRGQLNLENTNEFNSASALAPVVVGGSGTVGAIPKWTTATDLGDSVIAEDNGNVSIGSVPGARIRLRVYLKPDDINSAEAIQAVLQPSNAPNQQTTGSAVYALVQGPLGSNQGVWGISESNVGIGVHGTALSTTGENIGVLGNSKSDAGVGVQGEMNVQNGVTFGVKGINSGVNGRGVLGYATDTTGVNYGVVGRTESPNGFAGYFIGRVHVAGLITKAASTFKIDHPLDPENKYLSHSVVESPDMMNIYNGIVTLAKDGSAEVTLPEWFEALNREFRYQLTCIGGFAPVYVAKKVNGNRFRIAGGKPGMEVSWQLTGVRKDAYAEMHRVQVEEIKPIAERGSYLHPEAFGKSAEKNIHQVNEKAQQR
ncbi:MAG TPA: hypothetical protein VJ810_17650 [Blastocatellia bacterium]|nr:hypothetical protein [Blastocatellia bacterium]